MSLRDECRDLLAEARGIAGSADFGLHPFRVYFLTSTSSGSHAGDGSVVESDVEILENGSPPKVAKPGGKRGGGDGDRILFSDDAVDSDTFVVGPLTPVVGTPWSTMTGSSVSEEDTWYLRVDHTETGEAVKARVIDVDDSSALHVYVTAVAVSSG